MIPKNVDEKFVAVCVSGIFKKLVLLWYQKKYSKIATLYN